MIPTANNWSAPQRPNILIAEDHDMSRETLSESLLEMGFDVIAVPDGLQAVALAQNEVFSLILMDLQMPVMDGVQATRTIRAESRNTDTWIIALTANDMPESRRACRDAGCDGLIPKGTGIQFEALHATLRAVLGTPRASYRDGAIPAIAW